LEKVKLLLKKAANNPFPAEAEACMLKAQELLAKHNLEMQDVSLEEQVQKNIGSFEATDFRRIPWWYSNLSTIIANNFRCYNMIQRSRQYKSKGRIAFFGDKFDVDIAISVYQFAIEAISRFSIDYVRNRGDYSTMTQKERNALRNDYTVGFLRGMKEKFAEQVKKSECCALVLVKDPDVTKAYDTLTLRSGRASSVNCIGSQHARAAGYAQGRQFQAVRGQLR
jgi:hypothetical protein